MRVYNLIFYLFVIMLFGCSTNHTNFPSLEASRADTLYQIVESLAKENVIGDDIGIVGVTYRLDLFNKLNEKATVSELICLTDHQIPAVRYYAFRALTSRGNDKVFKILLNHMTDTMRVTSISGCTDTEETVVWNLINLVTSKISEPNGYKLTKDQLGTIDSICRIHPNPIYGIK